MSERLREKLNILADAAKYDVSCSSSGSNRKNNNKSAYELNVDLFTINLLHHIISVTYALNIHKS